MLGRGSQHAGEQNAVEPPDLFGGHDGGETAVALDFALVGVELNAPQPPIGELGRAGRPDAGQHLGEQARAVRIVGLQAQAQMGIRVGESKREPAIDPAVREQLLAQRLECRGEQWLNDAVGTVELDVQPLVAGRKTAIGLKTDADGGQRPLWPQDRSALLSDERKQ